MTTVSGEKTACVTGANGYVASLLVKQLLDKGYNVHATVRDPGNQAKVSHLLSLTGSERLKLFRADLTVEGSFDDPINGCHFVFHVASPVIFDSEDPENEIIKPAVQGTLNVLRTCAKTKTVKRVVLTSSTATVRGCREEESGRNLTEDNWSDVEFLLSEKPPFWAYSVSKTLAEKEAWKFAAENRIDLISVVSVLVSGPSLTPEVPQTVILALFLLMTEKDSASGRYICSAVDTNVPELAKFLSNRYPQHRVSTDFIDVSSEKVSGEKLIKEGFTFKFGIEEIYDESVEYLMTKGLLPK